MSNTSKYQTISITFKSFALEIGRYTWLYFLMWHFSLVNNYLSPLAAQIPLYLYPFLNTQNKTKQYEYLRLTSLGVIGALVKVIQR